METTNLPKSIQRYILKRFGINERYSEVYWAEPIQNISFQQTQVLKQLFKDILVEIKHKVLSQQTVNYKINRTVEYKAPKKQILDEFKQYERTKIKEFPGFKPDQHPWLNGINPYGYFYQQFASVQKEEYFQLKMPDTLIIGFGLPTPLFLHSDLNQKLIVKQASEAHLIKDLQSMIQTEENSLVPDFILKIEEYQYYIRKDSRQMIRVTYRKQLFSRHQVQDLYDKLHWVFQNTRTVSAILQQYISPKKRQVNTIRVVWKERVLKYYQAYSKAKIDGTKEVSPNRSFNLKDTRTKWEFRNKSIVLKPQKLHPLINKLARSTQKSFQGFKNKDQAKTELLQFILQVFRQLQDKVIFLKHHCNIKTIQKLIQQQLLGSINIRKSRKSILIGSEQLSPISGQDLNDSQLDIYRNIFQQFNEQFILPSIEHCYIYQTRKVSQSDQIEKFINSLLLIARKSNPKFKINSFVADFTLSQDDQIYFLRMVDVQCCQLQKPLPGSYKKAEFTQKKVICGGDYCRFIDNNGLSKEQKIQILKQKDTDISYFLQQLVVKGVAKYIQMSDQSKMYEINSNHQYKILKRTIIQDRNNKTYLLKNLYLRQRSFYGMKHSNYMKLNHSQLVKQKDIRDQQIDMQIVPVCAICFKVYKLLEKNQKLPSRVLDKIIPVQRIRITHKRKVNQSLNHSKTQIFKEKRDSEYTKITNLMSNMRKNLQKTPRIHKSIMYTLQKQNPDFKISNFQTNTVESELDTQENLNSISFLTEPSFGPDYSEILNRISKIYDKKIDNIDKNANSYGKINRYLTSKFNSSNRSNLKR